MKKMTKNEKKWSQKSSQKWSQLSSQNITHIVDLPKGHVVRVLFSGLKQGYHCEVWVSSERLGAPLKASGPLHRRLGNTQRCAPEAALEAAMAAQHDAERLYRLLLILERAAEEEDKE